MPRRGTGRRLLTGRVDINASPLRAILVSLAGMPDLVALLHVPALAKVAEYAHAATVEPPARSVFTADACPLDAEGHVVVAVLGYPDQLVEVEAIAAVRMEA